VSDDHNNTNTTTTDDMFFSDSHTTRPGVGTPFYASPEQERVGVSYDTKVDMYSLGIILFEMCCVFTSGMERIKALTNLRKLVFPPKFESDFAREAEIIKKLLLENPIERLSTTDLLKGSYLPPRMEEEILKEALNNITTNPSTTIFSTMMEKIFSITPDKHLDYSYDYHISTAFIANENLLREKVFSVLSDISQRHCAIQVETPMLIPKNPALSYSTQCNLVDESGSLLCLPFDGVVPFAR
jgi:translation initiation factor 2-alpha kinase 4